MKKITIKTEYIKLGQFIKFINIISSGGEIKYFLENNTIKVDGILENRRGKKLYKGTVVFIEGFGEYIIE